MNALTLWQPHASLIAVGVKAIGTRTHDHFGSLAGRRIAIHAAKRKVSYTEAATIRDELVELGLWERGRTAAWLQRRPLGAILCTALVPYLRKPMDAFCQPPS